MADDNWLLIGRIVGAHGLDGSVKVKPESDFPERFVEPGDRWLRKNGADPVQVRLLSGRFIEGKNYYLVKFAGVSDRDHSEALRGAELLVEASDRLSLEPGEFHVADLIGLAVFVQKGDSRLGTVTNVFTTGHDLLEVTLVEQNKTASENGETPSEEKQIEAEHASMRAKAVQKLRRQKRKKDKKKAPKTLLVPFVEEIVPVVNISTGRIEITPPPGLIEL
ncbi:MAG: ribosome maturation factor RimM [Phormidesmis sp.]